MPLSPSDELKVHLENRRKASRTGNSIRIAGFCFLDVTPQNLQKCPKTLWQNRGTFDMDCYIDEHEFDSYEFDEASCTTDSREKPTTAKSKYWKSYWKQNNRVMKIKDLNGFEIEVIVFNYAKYALHIL